ncbi:MAG: hypothetical protein ACLSH8_17420 [Zhenhengia sp.]|uniref:hypothetical protein n=1 Tax=Zhenhengia sp. TaxID=2944208 RepID=UPI00399451E9
MINLKYQDLNLTCLIDLSYFLHTNASQEAIPLSTILDNLPYSKQDIVLAIDFLATEQLLARHPRKSLKTKLPVLVPTLSQKGSNLI